MNGYTDFYGQPIFEKYGPLVYDIEQHTSNVVGERVLFYSFTKPVILRSFNLSISTLFLSELGYVEFDMGSGSILNSRITIPPDPQDALQNASNLECCGFSRQTHFAMYKLKEELRTNDSMTITLVNSWGVAVFVSMRVSYNYIL